jgi:hypothetical protein
VKVWLKEMRAIPTNRKLTFLYLANDVVQNARKYPEVGKITNENSPFLTDQ